MKNVILGNGKTYEEISVISVQTTTGEAPFIDADEIENPPPVLQKKTATENGTVYPDDGYDGLSEVEVNVQAEGGDTLLELAQGQMTEYVNATVETMDYDVFYANTVLESVNMPMLRQAGRNAASASLFKECTNLVSVNLPSVSSAGGQFLRGTSKLKKVRFPKMSHAYNYMLQVSGVVLADFGEIGIGVSGSADFFSASFGYQARSLRTVILRYSTALPGRSSAEILNSTPIKAGNGFVWVPDSLKDTYNTNFPQQAGCFKGFSEADAYASGSTHTLGDVVKHNGRVYVYTALTDGSDAPSGTDASSSAWDYITAV